MSDNILSFPRGRGIKPSYGSTNRFVAIRFLVGEIYTVCFCNRLYVKIQTKLPKVGCDHVFVGHSLALKFYTNDLV